MSKTKDKTALPEGVRHLTKGERKEAFWRMAKRGAMFVLPILSVIAVPLGVLAAYGRWIGALYGFLFAFGLCAVMLLQAVWDDSNTVVCVDCNTKRELHKVEYRKKKNHCGTCCHYI